MIEARQGDESPHPVPLLATRAGALKGDVHVPGDKSISHRALMIGLLTAGETRITGLLEAADVLATARIVRQLGAVIERAGDEWRVHGRGIGALSAPDDILDFENSGTSCRLMLGILATHPIAAHLTGDASLRKRPMGRVLGPLSQMGALAHARDGRLPIYIQGTATPIPITYEMPVASAQVKSAILLAGLNTPGTTCVIERTATRDHTERMLAYFGADIAAEADETSGTRIIRLEGQPELRPEQIDVPGDPSSAAFLVVAALITPGSSLTVRNVLMNEARTGLFRTLSEMGADLRIHNEREVAGERVADIEARACGLTGVEVPPERAASMIDEYPVLAVAAANAEGTTRMSGLGELRVKESDRLAAIAAGLEACGVAATEGEDWLEVSGCGAESVPGGGTVATHMDHRIAMAFLVLGLAAKAPVRVDDGRMIATSFPGFADLMASLGGSLRLPNR
jgi:3-phosphoshikimate 1-carboxyvinyltransferase